MTPLRRLSPMQRKVQRLNARWDRLHPELKVYFVVLYAMVTIVIWNIIKEILK